MRVLELITTAKWGGAQQQMLAIAQHASERGHMVHIACGEDGDLYERASVAGILTHRLRWLSSPIQPAADLLAMRELIALIRQLQPDVIHTHSSKAGVLGRVAARMMARGAIGRTPVVHHCHGLAWGPGRRSGLAAVILRMAEAATGRACDGVISVSRAVQEQIARNRLYQAAEQVVIYNSVSLPSPDPAACLSPGEARNRLGLPVDAFVITIVARLVKGKGHFLALRAIPELLRDAINAQLVIVGDGPLAATLQTAVAAEPRLAGRVHLLGFRRDVDIVLRASDVLCLASAAEGLGMVVLEAMLAGLPVVATAIPGLDELVEHGRTGLLVPPPGRPADLAAALRTLHDDPRQAREMGKAGWLKAARGFSPRNTAATVDFLVRMAAGGALGRTTATSHESPQ